MNAVVAKILKRVIFLEYNYDWVKALSVGYDDSDIFYLLGRLDHAKWNNPDLKEFVKATLDGRVSTGCSNPIKHTLITELIGIG